MTRPAIACILGTEYAHGQRAGSSCRGLLSDGGSVLTSQPVRLIRKETIMQQVRVAVYTLKSATADEVIRRAEADVALHFSNEVGFLATRWALSPMGSSRRATTR